MTDIDQAVAEYRLKLEEEQQEAVRQANKAKATRAEKAARSRDDIESAAKELAESTKGFRIVPYNMVKITECAHKIMRCVIDTARYGLTTGELLVSIELVKIVLKGDMK